MASPAQLKHVTTGLISQGLCWMTRLKGSCSTISGSTNGFFEALRPLVSLVFFFIFFIMQPPSLTIQ